MPETTTLPPSTESRDSAVANLAALQQMIERAGNLLPVQGPITAFVFLNALQAFEDIPFDTAVAKGLQLFGCQPYLSEDKYREKMTSGRIQVEDLHACVREDLGAEADHPVGKLGTRQEIRQAMLEFPLRYGPPEELRWFIAETDALTRLRAETPTSVRTQFLDETRHWVMRDFRGKGEKGGHHHETKSEQRHLEQIVTEFTRRFGEASMERWSPATWESLALQTLWRACSDGAHSVKPLPPIPSAALRHRDLLLEATGEDSDTLVHGLLIRYCAAFADQGLANWALPSREQGFFAAFCVVYGQSAGPPDLWLRDLPAEISRIASVGLTPLQSIDESLELLGVLPTEREAYVAASFIALRGWAGMIRQMEVRADRVPLPAQPGSFVEFLAVRLILERLALTYVAKQTLGSAVSLASLRHVAREKIGNHSVATVEQRAFLAFQIAQILGWTPPALHRLTKKDWGELLSEIESFHGLERRRVFHNAFERRFRVTALDAVTVRLRNPGERVAKPRFQATFCIDTREESFRRHLEEVAPDTETFGAAGFYGVPIYFKGVADAHFSTLCPIVVFPKHWVVEEPVYTLEQENKRRAQTRKAIGTASHTVHQSSRNFASGAILTASLGVLASIPLVARVLFPRLTSRILRSANQFVEAPKMTRLRLERSTEQPGPDGEAIGFSLEEMTNMGERMLRDIGLTNNFARLVLFFGHGSFCLNNPHKSAYDCGACSGGAGGPNARALAMMLNDPRVRATLASRGLPIPADTFFLGGLHNTCNDSITFFDLDLLPHSHTADLKAVQATLAEVCQRNAHERCRRFHSAPLNLTLAAAHRHVEGRAEDLAQTRPEFGNASNAMCYVGRRERIRGTYFDRRMFMHSYNPTQDDDDVNILGRILGAVVPVCSGINLQYFFSYVDSPGWGSGTKLPHNITSLLGVMDGASSDMRFGLPWQGVEIHEPVRLLFVIESTPEKMRKIMARNATVGNILKNKWVQLSLLDPHSQEILVYQNDTFTPYVAENGELPRSPTSADWYRGWRENLGFALIEPALAPRALSETL